MPEMHLTQSKFTYRACGPLTKKNRRKKQEETGDSRYIYQNRALKFKSTLATFP